MGEIENIIPDYTHQSQTVVARGRPAPAGAGHGLARLADNGLSASSTSAAMSSPDSKAAATVAVAPPQPAAPAAISSRMDTYPVDLPLIGAVSPHYSSVGGYSSQFGGRQFGPSTSAAGDSMASSSAGVVMSRQRHPGNSNNGLQTSTTQAVGRSAKLMAVEPDNRRQQKSNKDQYQQRSGVIQTPKNVGSQNLKPARGQQKSPDARGGNNRQQHKPVANNGGLGASASTLSRSQQKPNQQSSQTAPTAGSVSGSSINSSNNLLAISHNQLNQPSTSSIQAANSKQKSATYHSTTAPRHLTKTTTTTTAPTTSTQQQHTPDGVIKNRKQQFTNVNQQQQAQRYESQSSRANYGSPSQYSSALVAESQYHPTFMAAAAAA